MTASLLASRAIIRLSPKDDSEDVRDFLQGLITNDVSGDLPVYAALLSAQGKTMFDFFAWDGGDGALLLDCSANDADDLAKRLSLYRLRRKIEIVRDETVVVHWSAEPRDGASSDPRLPALGHRWIGPKSDNDEAADANYLAHRLAIGVTEGEDLKDILWLETNAVELNGVSFTKGCYIGQENTARMNWRQKVNRRLVVVPLDQSDEKRRKLAYETHGLAIDHLRVANLEPSSLPEWQRSAITQEE
ncbi:MAG: folate-binding protein [Pseudomonadota bacterium]